LVIIRKTQIAIEQCYRFLESHPTGHVFWAHADTLFKFVQACRNIAENLRLSDWQDPKTNALQLLHQWLGDDQNEPWLFVIDNLDDLDVLETSLPFEDNSLTLLQFFPPNTNGAIIVTTRDRRVGERLTVRGTTTTVLPMTTSEAKELLRSYVSLTMSYELNELERLVEALDCLPLAITQAAAYMIEQFMSVGDYMSILEDSDEEMQKLLNESLSDRRRVNHESNSVIKTWKLSFEQIIKQNPRAADILSLMSMFDREEIPSVLLNHNGESKRIFSEAIATLQNFSLVIKNVGSEAYTMHRLVQLSTQTWLRMQQKTSFWREAAIIVLAQLFPLEVVTFLSDCEEYLPHIRVVLQYEPVSDGSRIARAKLLQKLATYDEGHHRYRNALSEAEEALELFERIQRLNCPEALSIKTTVASCMMDMGEHEKAETLLRRNTTTLEQVLGLDHRETIASLNLLAWTLYQQWKLNEAEALQRNTLIRTERSFDPYRQRVNKALSQLTQILVRQGKLDEAKELQKQNVANKETLLGKNDSRTLWSKVELAMSLVEMGHYEEATEITKLSLASVQTVFGAETFETSLTMGVLASCLENLNRYEEAEDIRSLAVAISEKILGPENIVTLHSRTSLAECIAKGGRMEEAVEQFRLVLRVRERVLGFENADTNTSRHDLAFRLATTGQFEEAVHLLRPTLASRKKNLGIEAVDTRNTRLLLACCHDELGQLDEAVQLYRILLAEKEKTEDAESNDMLQVRLNLSRCFFLTNEYEEAAQLSRIVLVEKEKTEDAASRIVLGIQQHLTRRFFDINEFEETVQHFRILLTEKEKTEDAASRIVLEIRQHLTRCLYSINEYEETVQHFRTLLTEKKKVEDAESDNVLQVREDLTRCFDRSDERKEAAQHFRTWSV